MSLDLTDLGFNSVEEYLAADLAVWAHKAGNGRVPDPSGMLTYELLSMIEMQSITFIDRPLLQSDAFELLAGRKGVGKGTYVADTSARFTRGELGAKRNVVWIASEDSAAIDIKPRVIAAGGDPGRIAIVTDWLQLPRDVEKLANTITTIGNVGFVVIDPVGNHITGKNSNSETDIRDAIAPLNQVADDLSLLILGVRHLSEKEIKAGAIAAILGTSAWVQVPRAVLVVARDNDEPSISHIQCVAGNRLPPDTPGRAFRIIGVTIPGLEAEVTKAEWIGDSTKDIETLLEQQAKKKTSRSDTARELILDTLEAAAGMRVESDELDADVARKTGLAAQTVRNLRAELKHEGLITTLPEKDEYGTVVRWIVARSLAPRQLSSQKPSSESMSVTGPSDPVTVSPTAPAENGLTKPVTVQYPYTTFTVTGESRYPVTDSGDIGDLGHPDDVEDTSA